MLIPFHYSHPLRWLMSRCKGDEETTLSRSSARIAEYTFLKTRAHADTGTTLAVVSPRCLFHVTADFLSSWAHIPMGSHVFTSYAQNLEDILLWRALGHVPGGYYIDVGSHDPRCGSVSRGFYERGWRGVHFEPDPTCASLIRQDRPDEIVHELALSDRDGTVRFVTTKASGLSTGAEEYADEYRRSGQVAEERDVRTTTLKNACAAIAGRDIHWMKIDVEGMEEAVLRGWDSRTLRPWIVVVEATRPNSREPAHHAWDGLLVVAGYRFVLFDGLNRFYVAAERPELEPAFSAPVNIHDLASGCELSASSPFVAGTVAKIDASRSWRLTRPLRRLFSLLSENGARDD